MAISGFGICSGAAGRLMTNSVADIFERCVEITLVEVLMEREAGDIARAQVGLLRRLVDGPVADAVLGGRAFEDRVSGLWFDSGFVVPAIGFWAGHMANALVLDVRCVLEAAKQSVFGVRLERIEAGTVQPVLLRQLFVAAALEVFGSQAGLKRAIVLAHEQLSSPK